jgi:carbamoyl-phosphate synthase large subunit
MPKRDDIRHVMVIGSGPIVIGQACEFDYSGTQACRVLQAEGIRVSLVNSNPATIMTDPEFADATYIEPITPEFVEQVIAAERPDAILATLGGQTALNTAVALHENGALERYGVELIGADIDAIQRGEDRLKFKEIVQSVGGDVPRSAVCHSMDEVRAAVGELGLPVVIRPSFTMGGLGSGMARTDADLERLAGGGLAASPVTEVLIEESVLGWKEYELELMRDRHDNVVVVCSIENLDPMGVHTGDSITVAPAMTLTDREYQHMRDVGIAVLRAVGVDTGGCNIQFAVHPGTGRLVVIEMNPRVSRSSALASKATGFPIAKIAAKLAVGYTLDEIRNDITGETPAAFEPTLDYVVVKIPRFAFEKFPGADPELTTTMKSVGEAMALGRSFPEALGKALRSMETTAAGFWTTPDPDTGEPDVTTPLDGRIYSVERALRGGTSVRDVAQRSGIDPWFLDQILGLTELRQEILDAAVLDAALLRRAKRSGLSDRQIAALRPEFAGEDGVRLLRHRLGIRPVYKTVDTCAAEFAATTPYHYSAYETDPAAESEIAPQPDKPKVLILGSGPNRIGQGIEFDYSCVHAVMALREAGFETVMVNCNPETVSTDYDTADRLYFEPLTFEDVLEVVHAEQGSGTVVGVIVQLGGQTPLGLAQRLTEAGVPVVGTSAAAIDLAEDRGAFGEVLRKAGLPAPAFGMATSFAEARDIAARIGYPVLVRPSYVLGGRGMEIVYDDETLAGYISRATTISEERPVLVDRFLDDAVEIDVDALCDGTPGSGGVFVGGVMEHIEEAGVHSGDSSCTLPPITLGRSVLEQVRRSTEAIAHGVGVQGLLNVQYALHGETLYVLEANPRASRTVPFVSKATAVPLAKAAARIMLGATIAELRAEGLLPADGDGGELPPDAPIAVKEAVLPFHRFRTTDGDGVDPLLGPEMKSTGEVMGFDGSFGAAFAKSQAGAYGSLPTSGRVFVSIADRDKRAMVFPVLRLADLGFEVLATAGTADVLRRHGVAATVVRKHSEGTVGGPETIIDRILAGDVDMIINTPYGNSGPRVDGYEIRSAAVSRGIPCITTVQGAAAAVQGIEAMIAGRIGVRSLQDAHAALRKARS